MDHCKWRKMIKESDDQDGCEWVNVSSGTGPGQKAVKRLCVCVRVCVCVTPFSGNLGRSQYGQMHIEQKLQNAEQLVACSVGL